MSNEQEMREAFEADFKTRYSAPDFVEKYDSLFRWNASHRWYESSWINQHWETWKAVTLAAEARIRDLEADAKAGRLFKEMALLAHQNGEKGFWVKLDAALTEHKENQDGN